MSDSKIAKQFKTIKDIFLFITILILFFLPVLKQFYPLTLFVANNTLTFLKIIGLIGLFSLVIKLYIDFENSDNKKEYLKSILPIFILLLYMIWTFVSSLCAEDKHLAFYGTEYRKEGYFTYVAYAGIFGLAFCISSEKLKKILLYFFLIFAALTTIFSQFAKQGLFNNLFWSKDIKTASFFNSNHYGYYLLIATAISAFLFISEKNKILKVICLIIYSYLLYHLIQNDTFGCYLALILTLITFFVCSIIKKEKKFLAIILIILFVAISFFVSDSTTKIANNNIKSISKDIQTIASSDSNSKQYQKTGSGRMALWINGLKFIKQKYILGYGPENLESKYLEIGIDQDRPHNLIIQLATTSGIPRIIIIYFKYINYIVERP